MYFLCTIYSLTIKSRKFKPSFVLAFRNTKMYKHWFHPTEMEIKHLFYRQQRDNPRSSMCCLLTKLPNPAWIWLLLHQKIVLIFQLILKLRASEFTLCGIHCYIMVLIYRSQHSLTQHANLLLLLRVDKNMDFEWQERKTFQCLESTCYRAGLHCCKLSNVTPLVSRSRRQP